MHKLNWTTAFVIVSITFSGSFIYNESTHSAFGSDSDTITAVGDIVWQLKDENVHRS
jgi:hypothetical protein